jgi:hypothetical protein
MRDGSEIKRTPQDIYAQLEKQADKYVEGTERKRIEHERARRERGVRELMELAEKDGEERYWGMKQWLIRWTDEERGDADADSAGR